MWPYMKKLVISKNLDRQGVPVARDHHKHANLLQAGLELGVGHGLVRWSAAMTWVGV
jgi:hypothetical protein